MSYSDSSVLSVCSVFACLFANVFPEVLGLGQDMSEAGIFSQSSGCVCSFYKIIRLDQFRVVNDS